MPKIPFGPTIDVDKDHVLKLKKLGYTSKPFAAKFPGKCYLSGLKIQVGDEVAFYNTKLCHTSAINVAIWFGHIGGAEIESLKKRIDVLRSPPQSEQSKPPQTVEEQLAWLYPQCLFENQVKLNIPHAIIVSKPLSGWLTVEFLASKTHVTMTAILMCLLTAYPEEGIHAFSQLTVKHAQTLADKFGWSVDYASFGVPTPNSFVVGKSFGIK